MADPSERLQNIPAFKVTLDGKDLTERLSPRLLSLDLIEKRDGAADELTIRLHDNDGKLALPKAKARLNVQLGWKQGADAIVGLVNKGDFLVDEVEYSGPPDEVYITARSADFTGDLRIRRDASYRATTIGAIVDKVAARNGLKPAVAPELAAIAIPVLGQSNRSDMAMMRELGRRYSAVATVKAGHLIFSPIGRGSTPSGRAIPEAVLTRRDGDRFSYKRIERDKYDGVEAAWHDQGAAERKFVKVGDTSSAGKRKRLQRTYGSEAEAKAAASAEQKRLGRQAATLDYQLAIGRPDLYPERKLQLKGWKAEIEAKAWLIAEIAHSLSGEGGFTSALKLETA